MEHFKLIVFICLSVTIVLLIKQNNYKNKQIAQFLKLNNTNSDASKVASERERQLIGKIETLEGELRELNNDHHTQKQLAEGFMYKANLYNKSQLYLIKLMQDSQDRKDKVTEAVLMKLFILSNPDDNSDDTQV